MTTISVQTEERLLVEIHALVTGPVVQAGEVTKTQMGWRERGIPQPAVFHDAVLWILQAQQGALEKIQAAFAEERALGSMELLAVSRHLFEALVWLKLFNVDSQFGLVFYARFLAQQEESQLKLIEKIEQEVVLFEEYDALDNAALFASFDPVLNKPADEARAETARQEHATRIKVLDDEVRRQFTLYGAAAKLNGYGWQAHLLRTRAIPEQMVSLAKIREHLTRFDSERDTLMSGRYRGMAEWKARWNWYDRADEVGLKRQYDFLYGFTSRLLHATPMNLITETGLLEPERILLLEYVYVAVRDVLQEIEAFDFPGKIRVLILPEEDEIG